VPGGRTLLVALAVGISVGAYVQGAFGWPTFLAVALGAVMGVLILVVAASFSDDDAAADAAWRRAAPDIAGRAPGRNPAAPIGDAAGGERRDERG
jgi:hypothetical protein